MSELKVPKYWLISQCYSEDIESKHEEIMCNSKPIFLKSLRKKVPRCKEFALIGDNDYVIIYHALFHVVTGVYKVNSAINFGDRKADGNYCFYYTVETLPIPISPVFGKFDLKRFMEINPKFGLKSSHNLKEKMDNVYNDDFVFQLNPSDFDFLCKSLEEHSYYTPISEKFSLASDEVETTSYLLDFYNNRATAFIGLFIASLFGLVSFLSIVPNSGFLTDQNYWISFLPFSGFIAIGMYTWKRFTLYGQLSETIKSNIQYKLNHLKGLDTFDSEGGIVTIQKTLEMLETKGSKASIKTLIINHKLVLGFCAALMVTILLLLAYGKFYPFDVIWKYFSNLGE